MSERPRYLYFDGDFVPYEEAKIHVLAAAFKYSITVFEGIRAYWSEKEQLFIFRLAEHLKRLEESAKIARIPVPVAVTELRGSLLELVRRNDLREDLHIRILLFVSADNGMIHSANPVGLSIAAMPMGRFPERADGKDALDVCVSHWTRISDTSMPPRVKTTANYMNSRLALMQAHEDGYDDAILVDHAGKVTEGPGYNLFMVRGGKVVTPPATQGILEGVTRDTLKQLFQHEFDVAVDERPIDKTELYVAEEAFFCGSGKEVKAIGSVDHHVLGDGAPGPTTKKIATTYFAAARGELESYGDWLTPVY